MKEVIKFKSDDGCEFLTEQDCLKYEDLLDKVNFLMLKLEHKPTTCDFSNGRLGYIQQDKGTLQKVGLELLRLANSYYGNNMLKKFIDIYPTEWKPVMNSMAGRYIDDGGVCTLNRAWNRLMCIDDQGREWGQPYYAMNPHEASNQTQLNKR